MLKKAASFAKKAHEGQVRKGTVIPYITHPMEAAVIVSTMTEDEEVIAASMLHDVLEDTRVTLEELRKAFGDRVADLVLKETEDKTKTWKERKTAGIIHAKEAEKELQKVILGDKLSNMRCISRDYLMVGDQLWNRFNEKQKKQQAWYYQSMVEALKPLQEYGAYQEFAVLCSQVFGEQRRMESR